MTSWPIRSPTYPSRTSPKRVTCFPRPRTGAYFNTAAVGLASHALARTYHDAIDEWVTDGLDFARGEQAANDARAQAARLMGADPQTLR